MIRAGAALIRGVGLALDTCMMSPLLMSLGEEGEEDEADSCAVCCRYAPRAPRRRSLGLGSIT